ncbi:hypothetical protein CGRA01v4_08515 [Colletotrichum graminicola]|nr:hypothetical protein CGRA01v4_08515 [Colletotrichum graminicola]
MSLALSSIRLGQLQRQRQRQRQQASATSPNISHHQPHSASLFTFQPRQTGFQRQERPRAVFAPNCPTVSTWHAGHGMGRSYRIH